MALHLADGAPAIYEQRWISLVAVPEAREADFTAVAPGPYLLAQTAWTRARHAVGAIGANANLARQLDIMEGSACLVVERTTWRERRPVTFVRLTYPGHRHRLVGWFEPGAGVSVAG